MSQIRFTKPFQIQGSVKPNYYPDSYSLYIDLSERTSVESREISAGVVLDYDAEGNLVEVTWPSPF